MASRYLMQIVDLLTGEVASFEPGQRVEQDFVAACVDQSVAGTLLRGVGVGRTEAHVVEAMREGMAEGIDAAIHHLKAQVRP